MRVPKSSSESTEELSVNWPKFLIVRHWLPMFRAGISLMNVVAQVLSEARERRLTSDDWTNTLSKIDGTLRDTLERAGHDLPAVRLVSFKDIPKPKRKRRTRVNSPNPRTNVPTDHLNIPADYDIFGNDKSTDRHV